MTQFLDYSPADAIGPADVPLVSILTFCQHPGLLYGTLLTFKTLRVGFPTAEVEVWDNGSHPDLVDEIRAAAEGAGARFNAMAPRSHVDHLRWLFLKRAAAPDRPFVLCDPDIVFYEEVQGWDFRPHLLAGRLIPEHGTPRARTLARLHPSLLFVPSLPALRRALPGEAANRWNAIGGAGVMDRRGVLHGYDTLAPLYAVIRAQCYPFGTHELDAYSHLFQGTHLAAMGAKRDAESDILFDSHRAAIRGDLEALRGIWRAQEAMFRDETQPKYERQGAPVAQFREVLGWQERAATDLEAVEAVETVRRRLASRALSNAWDPTPPHERERQPGPARAGSLTTWARVR